MPFASPTGRVDIFGFVIIYEEKKELTSMFYSLQKQRKHSEERSFGRFKMSLKCDWMFTLVSSKCNLIFGLNTETHWKINSALGFESIKPTFRILSLYTKTGVSDYRRIPQATTGYRRIPPGGGGGGVTLICSCIHRLGPFFGVQNSEFQYFLGFSEKLIFFWGMKILWIFFGVITKLG